MNKKCAISKNAINELLKLPITNEKICVNYTFEVGNWNWENRYNNSFYTATLEDQTTKYSGFILKGNPAEINIRKGDFITANYVMISSWNKSPNKVIIISKFEIEKRKPEKEHEQGKTINKNNNNNISKNNHEKEAEKINNPSPSGNNDKEDNLKKLLSKVHDVVANKNWNSEKITNILTALQNELSESKEIEKPSTMSHGADTEAAAASSDETNPNNNCIDLNKILPSEFVKLCDINTFTKIISIYVKIIKMNDVKTFLNKRSNKQSRILAFNICDISGFIMQAALFDSGIDKYGKVLQLNEIFYISGGYAKLSEQKFSNLESNYRWVFDTNTKIYHIPKSFDKYFPSIWSLSASKQPFNYKITRFTEISVLPDKTVFNSIAYVLDISPAKVKQSRIGEISWRTILIGDSSRIKWEITFWKEFSYLPINKGDIMLLRDIRVCDYNGKILSTIDSSNIYINPQIDIPPLCSNVSLLNELNNLKEIISSSDGDVDYWAWLPENRESKIAKEKANNTNIVRKVVAPTIQQKLPQVYYIKEICNFITSKSESPLARLKATIIKFVHSNKNYFTGCPNKTCKKKAIYIEDTKKWQCSYCNNWYDKPYYYYTISFTIVDASKEISMDWFGDNVAKLFGISCEEYKEAIDKNNVSKWNEINDRVLNSKYWFTGKGKIHVYNNISKRKFFAYKFDAYSEGDEAWKMLANLKRMFER